MTIAKEIIGTHYRYPDHFTVDREKIREFAKAVKTTTQLTSPRNPQTSWVTPRWWHR